MKIAKKIDRSKRGLEERCVVDCDGMGNARLEIWWARNQIEIRGLEGSGLLLHREA